ncbi:MAG: Trk system potassium transporter TrkA [Deltaproteobacteria bacterium]|jgi:trk system potassium uptake protein TrkA|nr:Trk system potassium transporter TrkA [Deltaproteobacteria bacterium]MBW2484082.1 Trk system potassium transporter TrkA [Deltaproteobacteria bacterium]
MFRKKVKAEQENILILGLGGMGFYLAKRLQHEGYSVTAIEPDPKLINYADSNLDARFITGSALTLEHWREANASEMDYLIAVTNKDALNMMGAQIADSFGISQKICRVRHQEYGKDDCPLTAEDLKINLFIHPEELVAREIVRLIKRTAGNEIIDVAMGQVQVMATRINPTSPLANKNLKEIAQTYNEFPFRVVAIARGISTIIPGGKTMILPHDQVLIMASKENLPRLMDLTGVKLQGRYRVMILGGGMVGSLVAEMLGKTMQVKLVEMNEQRAEELSAKLEDTEVLLGDGSDKEVLLAAGLLDMDTFIAATGENETNIMSCLLAKYLMSEQDKGRENTDRKTISLVTKEDYQVLATTSGSDIALNKKILAGNEILTFIRRSELLSVSHLHGFDAEVVDLIAPPGAPITNKPLAQLHSLIAGKIIIGSVFRDNEWQQAVGDTHIQEGERVIVICASPYFKDLRKLFLF